MNYFEKLENEFGTTVEQLTSEAVASGRALGYEGEDLEAFVEYYLEGGPTTAEIRMQMHGL
jgi:hypothetical protein